MRQFPYSPYQQKDYGYYNGLFPQPFHPLQYQQQNPTTYQQPKTPFEQFSKPTQPKDWYTTNQAFQGNQQAQGIPQQQGIASQFQNQNGQLNLDKVLSTVSQMANTYHQVSPIIKQFGSFMKTFR